MNRNLRFAFAVVLMSFFAVGAFAQAAGDRIVRNSKVYVLVSENLITNPNFDDNFTGWTSANDFSTELTESNFEIRTEEEHGNFLVGKVNTGAAGAGSIGTAWGIEDAKTYLYAFDVKSLKELQGEQQYLKSSLTTTKGEETSVLPLPTVTAGSWTTYEQIFKNEDSYTFLQAKFRWLDSNFGFDNFQLFEVSELLDLTDLENAENEWRDANVYITKLDEQAPGEVYTDAVLEKMNEANKLLANIKAAAEDPTGDLSNASNDIATALALIAEAKAMADENLLIAKALPEGEYYFKTTYDSKVCFLGGANNWGTHASLIPNSVLWNLEKVATNVYKVDSYQSNGGGNHYLGSNSFVDAGACNIYFTEQSDGTYTLSLEASANYLKCDGMGFHRPTVSWGGTAEQALKFEVISKDAEIKKYDDVTYLLRNANFDTNNRWAGHRDKGTAWKMESSNQNLRGGEAPNTCAESWHAAFTLSSDTLKNLPNGYYTMTVQAAVRDDANKWDGVDYPVAYINEATAPFIEMENVEYTNYTIYRWGGDSYTHTFNPSVNGSANMWDFSQLFAEGKYTLTVPVKVTDGKIVVGAKGTRTDTWCIFDNFTLKFMGDDATDYNEVPYADLLAAYNETKDAFDAAKTEVDGLDAFVQTAVAGDETKIGTDLDKVKADIEKAHTDIKCAEQKDALLAALKTVDDAVKAYLEKANGLQDGNDDSYATMDEAYDALVQKWQTAYDKINTEYKEFLNSDDEVYNGYLKQLNSLFVDIDAMDATIAGYKTAGTCVANEETMIAKIVEIGNNVDLILATALNAYNDEVCANNQKAYKEVTDKCDAITTAYKAAILKVSEHYADYHADAAAQAQVDLFAIYTNVQTVKTNATEQYANIESVNAVRFANEDLPLTSFDNTYFLADLNTNSEAEIEAIMATVEAAAAAEASARNAELQAANDVQVAALADLNTLIATYGLDASKYESAIASIQGHLDYVNNYCALDFHANVAQLAMIVTRRNNNNGSILSWGVYGSATADAPDADWERIATINTPLGNKTDSMAFMNPSYPYLRFYFESTQGNKVFGHMSEFQVKDAAANKALITDASQLTSPCSDSAEGQHIEYLLDGDAATFWHSDWHGAYTAGTHYIQVALSEVPEGELKCAIMSADEIEAETTAAKDEIAALTELVKGNKSDELLAAIQDKAKKANEALEAALPDTYEESVQEKYAEQYNAIAKDIADVVTEATAADEAGTLITKYAALDAKLGEAADVYADMNVVAVTMEKGTGSSYDDLIVNDKPSIKVGTSSKTGSAHIVVPAGVKTVTFYSVAWKGTENLDLSITDGSSNPAKVVTIHGNDGLAGNGPYTLPESAETLVTYEFAALTTAEVTLNIAADKRFIIWGAKGSDGQAAENSDYALINNLAANALNENYNVLFTADLDEVKANFADAKTVVEGLTLATDKAADIATINAAITTAQASLKTNYEAVTLAANNTAVAADIQTAQDLIDALLAVCYQEDLQAKIADVKTTWNIEYAKLETSGQLTDDQKTLFDGIYDDITALSTTIDTTTDYDAESYAEDADKIANLGLFFSDFSQWVKDNYLLGDANLSDDVTVSDAVLAVSFALESATPNERQQYTADANQDGVIDVADAVGIINIALGISADDAAGVKALAPSDGDYLILDGRELSLVNENDYAGFQFDITLADGATFEGIELSSRCNYNVSTNKLANGNIRVIAMSLNNTVISDNEGLLLTIKGQGDLTLTNAKFSDKAARSHYLDIEVVTGINSLNADMAGAQIYTIGGARVSKVQKGGIYVVNGKKLLVK